MRFFLETFYYLHKELFINLIKNQLKSKSFYILILVLICSKSIFYSQDLKNEMFTNRNTIDNNFVGDEKTEKLFDPKSKDSIIIIAKAENNSLFSIYVKNNKYKTLKLIPEDNSLYIIQEALNQKKEWKPIEFWGYSTCGNSYENKIIFEPKSILHLTTMKYSGGFKTKIRFRLLLENKIYFSNELPSTINLSKFEKSTWFNQLSRMYKPTSEASVEDLMFLKIR